MLFAWDDLNREHIAMHRVTPDEAEEVILRAEPPYPAEIADRKLIVWGPTDSGLLLQVIYVLKNPDEVAYGSLSVEDWMTIETGAVTKISRVIHAMELTSTMKKRCRRRTR